MGTGITGIAALAFDCDDPPALARFWQHLLGGEVVVDDGGDAELRGAAVRLDFLRVPEGKAGKNRLHLDLRTDDHEAAVQHAIDVGAHPATDVYDGGRWTVLRDPEGNELCLLRPPGDPAREDPEG
jgi:catechol 2,3-dioxygenase-like lactoylglutathione lyase family enzyme